MKLIVRLFFLLLILGSSKFVSSQSITLTQKNSSGIYKKGEKIRVTVALENLHADSVFVNIVKNYSSGRDWKKIKYTGSPMILFEGSMKKSGSMIFEVKVEDYFAGTGLVVAPEKLKPETKRPKDFDAFWKSEKDKLHNLPMEVKATEIDDAVEGFICSDVEINCTGPKPARGYFAKPRNAKNGTLPIVLNVHAAGVKGSWCLSRPETALEYAKKGKGALSFDLNAHGMLNGQPQEYYDELETGELKNYWEIGAENKEDFYFRGMYLRLLRTLDFLCSQPEWDGKRIIVIGESQGGGQALVAAGLDRRVTAAVATVPAMCDFGRTLTGEKGGWPNPFGFEKDKQRLLKTVPYFDAAYILKNSKATLVTEIGLIDYTCPSLAIYAALNQSKGKKIILPVPYRAHHQEQKKFQEQWEKDVYKTKMDFINDFLK